MQSQNKTNESILKEVIRYGNERRALEEKDHVIEVLYQTMNGKITKAAKMDLETYVQRQYFKQIIAQANKRLTFESPKSLFRVSIVNLMEL